MLRLLRHLAFLVSLAFIAGIARDAHAGDAAAAQALFEQGKKLMAEKKYAEACPKFEESQKLRPGIGTLFNLADCHEKVGKLTAAYQEFKEVVERTKVALQPERQKIAEERVAEQPTPERDGHDRAARVDRQPAGLVLDGLCGEASA